MHYGRTSMGFAEKKVSINAVMALILGILLNLIHVGMMIYSVIKKGDVPFYGGLVESYILLFSIFGVLWAVLSLDDEKTVENYKVPSILFNGIALAVSILIMILGIMNY